MKNWYCVYTKPKREDPISVRLIEFSDIDVFNPKFKKKKYNNLKTAEIIESLFPSYIFLNFDPDKYLHMIKYTRGVRRIVGDRSGVPYIVDESIINFIKDRLKDGFLDFKLPSMVEGERVEVVDGPFSGLTGIFLKELKPSERIMVLLDAIEYQARIEMPREFVKNRPVLSLP